MNTKFIVHQKNTSAYVKEQLPHIYLPADKVCPKMYVALLITK